MKDASAHANRKEDIRLAIARSRMGVTSTAPPSSPEYAQQDPLEDDVVETEVGGDVDDGALA